MPHLSLNVLGTFSASLDEHIISTFGYDKVRALLAYLAVEADRSHRRDTLAEMFWPDQAAGIGRNNLRRALVNLRQALDDYLEQHSFLLTTRETLQFNVLSDHTLDLTTFKSLLQAVELHNHTLEDVCEACAERLAQATALYRGEFLSDIIVRGSVTFEEWTIRVRSRLQQQMQTILIWLMTYYERRGLDETAQSFAWRQIELDSANEAGYRCLMRTFTRSGQRTAALSIYEQCVQALESTLGVTPSEETVNLYALIRENPKALFQAPDSPAIHRLQASPSVSRPPSSLEDQLLPVKQQPTNITSLFVLDPTILPAFPTPLIGRETQLKILSEKLLSQDVRLLTITGAPGIGKTRIAIELASRLQAAFVDDIFFVQLGSVTPTQSILSMIAQAVGIHIREDESLLKVLLNHLRHKHVLLILDAFEQFVAAAREISTLLTGAPHIKLLITSRVVLRLYGEWEYAVPPLALPTADDSQSAEQAFQSEAVQLFVRRAQAVRNDFLLTVANAPIIAAICHHLDGLPLAIELAATHSKVFPLPALHRRLDHRLKILSRGARDVPPHQQTLRNTLDWSYELLEPGLRTLFQRLSIFVGGWTIEAAERICFSQQESELSLIEGLTELLDHNLIQQHMDADGEPRFSMLETIREYALERLQCTNDLEGLRMRHATYYLSLVSTTFSELITPDLQLHDSHLLAERGNLSLALIWMQNPLERDSASSRLNKKPEILYH